VVRKRVAVVGAGLAGLAAGLNLKAAGCSVDLYERSRLLGGRATSFEVGGREVDNGQHVFLACCSAFREFVARVGMAQNLHVQPRFDARIIARDGAQSRLRAAALPAPLHLLVSFARYRHLSFGARIRVARALVAASRDPDPADRTFAQWLVRHGQDESTIRAFWEPFFVPAINAPLGRMATKDALFVVRTAFLGSANAACFGFSTVPLARIAQSAAEKFDRVHLSTGISGIDAKTPGRVRLQMPSGENAEYDAVVVAVPPPALARLLGDCVSYGIDGVDAFEAFPIIDVHLWHDVGTLGFDFAALLDSPVQWIFEKAPGYVCASMSAAGDYISMNTEELARRCWEEARAAIPALRSATLTERAVTRNPFATYLPALGEARPAQRTHFGNVAIAGSWTSTGWPDTMEGAVRSGIAAAGVILEGVARQDEVESVA
jgi:squalene-associated FAD-dependent desaturase